MPTQEQLRRHVNEFERQYPASLPDRLQWWVRVLGLDPTRLFLLLGLPDHEAARTPRTALPRIVQSNEDRAELVDDMLGELLASFDYNLAAMRTAMHRPVGPASGEERPAPHRPDDLFPPPYTPSPRALDEILLNHIFAGGPFAVRALQGYLSQTQTSDRSRKRRKD